MKYIILIILFYWITQRVFRIVSVVGEDKEGNNPPNKPPSEPSQSNYKASSKDKGEYVDFEEID